MPDPKPWISKKYRTESYDTKERWMSYWHQINEVIKTGGRNILEIGVGNKTVSNYLKEKGLKVTTVDIDPSLNPDRVCSVVELTKFFKQNSFDTVLCAEVLEHLPFTNFKKSLKELYQISKKWIILSLPYAGFNFRLALRLPGIGERSLKLKVPLRMREHKFDGEHYWEIGKKGYAMKKILKILKQNFEVVRTYLPPENMYHIFFVLKKKKQWK